MRRSRLIIAGGGPAGCAAAIMLARRGAVPLILERQRETGDALCGGFLSWRTLKTLVGLGVALEGHKVSTLRVTSGSACVEADLPGGAIGVSRRVMDTALQAQAVAVGGGLDRDVTIRRAEGLSLVVEGDTIEAETLFLATGKHELRGLARPRLGETIGLRLRLPPHPALLAQVGPAIELHLFRGGYAGLVLQEDGSANLCLAVGKARFDEAATPIALFYDIATENAHLAERLGYGEMGKIDAIAGIPYGWRARETEPGVFRLGDQAAVIPSLAGEGNGIALASGIAAAHAWHSGQSAHDYQQVFARRALMPLGIASLLWRLAERPVCARMGMSVLPRLARHLAAATRIG